MLMECTQGDTIHIRVTQCLQVIFHIVPDINEISNLEGALPLNRYIGVCLAETDSEWTGLGGSNASLDIYI